MDGNNYNNNNQNGSSDSFYSYNNGSQSNQQTEHANEGNVNQYNNSYQNTNSYSQNAGYQQGSAYQNGTSQLRSLVEKMMTKQGTAIANADSMWSFLADGNFTVDEETQKQAQADIAEDGYWGVEQTSDRILDFAKALSGNDPEKADLLIDAFKKGFEDATKSWGKDLPDISQRTYDAVLEKFDKWKNGSTTETAGTETEN